AVDRPDDERLPDCELGGTEIDEEHGDEKERQTDETFAPGVRAIGPGEGVAQPGGARFDKRHYDLPNHAFACGLALAWRHASAKPQARDYYRPAGAPRLTRSS